MNENRGTRSHRLSMRDILMPFCKRHRLFFAVLGGFVLVVGIGSRLLPKSYTAKATVLVESKREQLLQSNSDNPSVVRATDIAIDDVLSEVELLKTRELFQQAVTKFEAAPDELVRRLGLNPGPSARTEDVLASYLNRRIEVEPVTNSNIIEVKFKGRDPQFAADAVNALMDAYVEYRRTLGGNSFSALVARQNVLREELDELEDAVKEFDNKWGLVDPAKQKSELLSLQGTLRAEASRVQAQLEGKQREFTEISQHLQKYSPEIRKLEPVRTSEKVLLLETEETNIERRLSQLSLHYSDDHRETRELRARLADVQAAIRGETEQIVRSIVFAYASEIGGLEEELATYERRQAKLDSDLERIRANEVTSQRMQLDLEIKRDQYTAITKRLNQVSMESAVAEEGGVEVVVASRAYPPRGPSFPPSFVALFVISLVAGTFTGLSAVMVADFLDHTVSTPQDVEDGLGLPVLATIPRADAPLLFKPEGSGSA